jgi:hypothetical protein
VNIYFEGSLLIPPSLRLPEKGQSAVKHVVLMIYSNCGSAIIYTKELKMMMMMMMMMMFWLTSDAK